MDFISNVLTVLTEWWCKRFWRNHENVKYPQMHHNKTGERNDCNLDGKLCLTKENRRRFLRLSLHGLFYKRHKLRWEELQFFKRTPPSHHEACEFVPSNHAKRTAPLVTQKPREREWSDLDYRVWQKMMTFLRLVPRGRVPADREKVAQREAPRAPCTFCIQKPVRYFTFGLLHFY